MSQRDEEPDADLARLPAGWRYEHAEWADRPRTRARCEAGRATFWIAGDDAVARAAVAEIAWRLDAAIHDGLIAPDASAQADRPGQSDMFAELAPAQLAEDRHTLCPIHQRMYQPHCWHCKRRRPDRPHRRARQA